MKKNYLALILLLTLTFQACTDGYESPVNQDVKEVNLKILEGINAKEEWTKTPQAIVKVLFPETVHNESNSIYKVEEKRLHNNSLRVVITQEGAIDDEVNGERTVLTFKVLNGKWLITEMTYAARRRYWIGRLHR